MYLYLVSIRKLFKIDAIVLIAEIVTTKAYT